MHELDEELFSSVRCSQASTQELSETFPSQESQNIEELAPDISKVNAI